MLKHVQPMIAAELLGKSPQYVRIGLQRDLLPFGKAVKMSSVYTYHISPRLFSDYTGIPIEDIEKFIEEKSVLEEAKEAS